MREIKCRGKRRDRDEWVYGELIIEKDHGEIYAYILIAPYLVFYGDSDECYTSPDGYIEAERIIEVIPETVGQYTGLNDKNGRQIYEGDIITCEDKDCLNFEVRWNNGRFGYYHENKWQGDLAIDLCKGVQVVGNIYKNSDQ